jgi:hypothetical protein
MVVMEMPIVIVEYSRFFSSHDFHKGLRFFFKDGWLTWTN